ncbi:MAG: OB-fold nucleic acid binding domain-containing protein [Candidatus Bathyarchaeia archaeon]|jgi:replication factor A1
MTIQDIIQKILAENPDVTQEQILVKLRDERNRAGGLLGDETLLRLIAARYGVKVEQNGITNNGILASNRLFAGLNDVTVEGRLIAVSPVRTFEGEKPGRYATLMIADNDGILRVVLWNDKANLVESSELDIGQTLRLVHGYTRADRYGKMELHLGGKSKIEVKPPEKTGKYPETEKFTTKIGSLNTSSGAVQISGKVKGTSGLTTFTRSNEADGKVMRITLTDDTGQVTAVVWNEKATELETLKINSHLHLINARVKEAQDGGIEVHVDSSTYINVQNAPLKLTKIDSLTENQTVSVQGTVVTAPQIREVTTGKGENVKLMTFILKDDRGSVRVSAWRQQADELKTLKIGDELLLENVIARMGFEGKIEISTRSGTVASIKTHVSQLF